MQNGRQRGIGPWILAVGLLVAGALVLLLAQPGRDAGGSIPLPRTSTESNPSAEPAPPPAGHATGDIEPVEVGADVPPPVAPEPPTTVTYTGRVVGARSEPIAAATVWLIPGSATLRANGHPLGALSEERAAFRSPTTAELLAAMTPESFESTESDGDGRFRITVELSRAGATEPTGDRLHPELFARAAGRRPALHVCRERVDAVGDAPAEVDIGVLSLLPGVSVQGRVVDERLAPFAGVEVAAAGPTPHVEGDRPQAWFADFGRNFGVTASGSDGRFRLDGLAPSSDTPLRLEFDTPGFDGVRREIFAAAGEAVELGDVRIDRGLTIAGRVVDEGGRPLEGALVRLTDEVLEWNDTEAHVIDIALLMIQHDDGVVGVGGARDARFAETTSGPDGRFEIGGLDARTEYAAYAWTTGREPARVARLAAGGPEVELRLAPRGRLELVLVDARTAVPVRDATVRAFRRMIDTFPNALESVELPVRRDADDSSRFIVDEVCPSEIGLLVDSPGHGQHGLIAAGLPLGSAPAMRELRIVQGATLGGVVVWLDTGASLTGATVELTPDDRGGGELLRHRRLVTGDQGTFRFEGIAPGAWRLRASADGALPAFDSFVVKPAEEHLGVTLELSRAARFEGLVSVAGRGPVAGAHVAVKESAGWLGAEGFARTGDDGRYAVGVEPGRWVLEFSGGSAGGDFPGASIAVGEPAVVKEASVAAGQTTVVDAELPAPARLSGVARSAGEPVPEARIAVRGRGVELSLRSDAEGRFEREVPGCGELALIARSPRGGISEAARVFVEPGGEAWAEVRFGGRTLSGRVLEAGTGMPIALARIVVSATGSREERPPDADNLVTDADGRFVIEDMGIGEYRVQASHDDHSESTAQALAIAPADRAPSITLELARANRLTGFVRDAEGVPVRTRLVVTAWNWRDSSKQYSAVTAEDGGYKISRLPDGNYQVIVTPPGFDGHGFAELDDYVRAARGWGWIEIEDGQDAQLDITLRPRDD